MGNYICDRQSSCISQNFQTHTFRYIFSRFVYLPWKKRKKRKMVGVVTFLLARLARLVCGARIIVPSEQEQEQSSLYIVKNKFLISSRFCRNKRSYRFVYIWSIDTLGQPTMFATHSSSIWTRTILGRENWRQLLVRMDDSRRKIMTHWHCT